MVINHRDDILISILIIINHQYLASTMFYHLLPSGKLTVCALENHHQ